MKMSGLSTQTSLEMLRLSGNQVVLRLAAIVILGDSLRNSIATLDALRLHLRFLSPVILFNVLRACCGRWQVLIRSASAFAARRLQANSRRRGHGRLGHAYD